MHHAAYRPDQRRRCAEVFRPGRPIDSGCEFPIAPSEPLRGIRAMRKFRIPRRTFLRGAGVSILLPALDIMLQPGPAPAGGGPGGTPRYVAFFLSLGMGGQGYAPTKSEGS